MPLRRLEVNVQRSVRDIDTGHRDGKRGSHLAVAEQHHIDVVDDPAPFDEGVEDALLPFDGLRLREMKRNVVGAVGNGVLDADIARAVGLVQERILRALDRLDPADGASLYGSLCNVGRTVARLVSRAPDVHGPDDIFVRMGCRTT